MSYILMNEHSAIKQYEGPIQNVVKCNKLHAFKIQINHKFDDDITEKWIDFIESITQKIVMSNGLKKYLFQ